jgi:type I restriction-modification system DNA methylase subunit
MTKAEAFTKISELVHRFDEQLASYKKSEYNETQTRRDFIDPFFKALGWDVDNTFGSAEAYREVIHEDKIKVGTSTKAPDYSFRLTGGQRLFFVEAKKPSVDIREQTEPAFQIRRYGWSAKLSVSIITNFSEFAVYDCTKKPHVKDKAAVARIECITFREYLDKFDFLWDTFSQERVKQGSFDKFVQSGMKRKVTTPLDKEFLESLDAWRKHLALNLSLNNKRLTEDELNFAVQQTIDRIIFLRIAEARGIEEDGNLTQALKQGDYYKNLFRLFTLADKKYNSGLFDFNKDDLSHKLKVDNKVIQTIIDELCSPDSPYVFSVMPVEILGSAYEQFLGKQIRITKDHRATNRASICRIEEKPEVRKAGGVYYTPQYIVDYIVQHTLGTLLENKTPADIRHLKIVDPACGSGSFLLGAYQALLDYHKKFYAENLTPTKGQATKGAGVRQTAKLNPLTPDGHLTTSEKKRILLQHIYGVDIDVNAVEVTKLSLLLKCMEGETKASIETELKLFNERVLPTLDANIKSGNSLIDTDFYDSELDFGEEKKIKPFNWQRTFPEVFKQGGFDVVIGNPPYVFGRDWKSLGIGDNVKSYLGNHYKSSPYQLDFFSIFMEKGVRLVNETGLTSFIVPNVWLTNTYSSSTRKFLLANAAEMKIAVPENKVFEGITVDTVIFILRKGTRKSKSFTVSKLAHSTETLFSELDFTEYASGEKPISTSLSKGGNLLIDKIKNNNTPLGDIADITRGVHPYRVGGFGKSAFGKGVQIQRDVDERPYHSNKPKAGYRPFIYGKDLKCFTKVKPKEFINYGKWLAEPRDEKFFEGDRIYSRKILGETLIVTVEKENTIADQQVYITKPHSNKLSVNYLSAILGSKLISFFIRNYFDEVNDAFPQIKVGQLKSLPIKIDGEKNQSEIIKLVDQLLNLNEQLPKTTLATEREQLQSHIAHSEERLNALVYALYGLTADEIAIVEAGK